MNNEHLNLTMETEQVLLFLSCARQLHDGDWEAVGGRGKHS